VDIVAMSHTKMMQGKDVLDDFTTIQEILAHGNTDINGKKRSNPLLSVTTV
jgi:hypothetical protein